MEPMLTGQLGVSPREQADPSFVLVAGYLHADTRESPAGLSGVSETVEPGGDDEDERSLRGLQRALDAGSVEQAEGGVQGLAEASVGVVEHRSGVDDDTDPQLAFRRAGSVVLGQQQAESRNHTSQQHPGGVIRMDERQQAVAPVGESVLSRSKIGSACWRAVSSWRQAARLYSLISPFSMDFRRIRWTSRSTAVTPGASHP